MSPEMSRVPTASLGSLLNVEFLRDLFFDLIPLYSGQFQEVFDF